MFGFCFAMAPLYSILCKETGFGGKTGRQVDPSQFTEVDKTRKVTVEFISTLDHETDCEFYPSVQKMVLHPGEMATLDFYAKNLKRENVVVQAIPSVTPGIGARHIKKVECFCFQKQPLEKRELKRFPLQLYISPKLPKHVKRLTLAYTLFDITP